MNRIVISLLLILQFVGVHAQDLIQSLGNRFNVSYFDIKSGLPRNYVNDIMADNYGFMWISTYGGGLVRYDGYRFEKVSDTALNSNASRSVCEDAFHRLWVAYDEHINVIDLKTLKTTIPKYSLGGDISKLISEPSMATYSDTKKRIWLITRTKIYVLSFDEEGRVKDVAHCDYHSNTPDVTLVDVNADGQVWANINGGLYRLEKKGNRLIPREIAPAVRAVNGLFVTDMFRKGQQVWIGTNEGLYCYNQYTKQMRRYEHSVLLHSLSHDFVTCIRQDEYGQMLVGTLGGVNIYRANSDDFEVWNSSSIFAPLCSDFVNCLFVFHHQLWVGTENGGIIKLSPKQLLVDNYVHSSNTGSISANLVNSMYVEKNGRVWVGTVEGGLNRKDVGSRSFVHFTAQNSGLTHNTVSTLTADDYGRLWIGTWGGGVSYVDLKNPNIIIPLPVDDVHRPLLHCIGALVYDKRNDGLWIGSNDGLFFYDNKTRKVIDPFPDCRNVRGCIGSIIDSKGFLWMGNIYGVISIDIKKKIKGKFVKTRSLVYKLDEPDSKAIDHITSFCESKDGTLWLGSNNYGLYHRVFDKHGKEHFESLTTHDGLPNDAVKGIVEDAHGRLWITTENGLVVYSEKGKTFTNYSEANGLLSSEFYWNSIVMQDGKFYLGSKDGLSVIAGENMDGIYDGQLRFTGLTVDNQHVLADGSHLDEDISIARCIHLHESVNSFSIDFSVLNFGSEDQGTYSYRMIGMDNDWTSLKYGEHSVRYSKLAPGRYTFEVRYTSALNKNEKQSISIDVIVIPYFYKSWWFILLMFFLFTSLAIYIYKRRVRELRRMEAEKQLRPIKKILEESDDGDQIRQRISHILYNEEKYKNSFSKSIEADKEKTALKLGKPFIDRAMEILEKNYTDSEFGMDEFCQTIGMNRNLVNKYLNTEAGVPIGQFIRNYRLNVARELLAKNKANRNITEIAYSVGFNDPKYFTRCFTKMYGVSPSNYVG